MAIGYLRVVGCESTARCLRAMGAEGMMRCLRVVEGDWIAWCLPAVEAEGIMRWGIEGGRRGRRDGTAPVGGGYWEGKVVQIHIKVCF